MAKLCSTWHTTQAKTVTHSLAPGSPPPSFMPALCLYKGAARGQTGLCPEVQLNGGETATLVPG